MSASLSSRPLLLAAAGMAVAGLTGCSALGGGSDNSASGASSGSTSSPHVSVPTTVTAAPTATPSTSAPTGSISSDDNTFSLVSPTGWKRMNAKPATLAIKAPKPQDKVTTNFNVVVQSPKPVPALDDVVTQAEIAWRQQGVHIKDKPDRTIGGLPARGYSFDRKAHGAEFTQTQYFVVFRSHVYSMTMTSASTSDASGGADQALNAIFSTWAWKQH